MRPYALLLALTFSSCNISWDDDDSSFVVDGYELQYERTVGLVLGDLTDQPLAFDSSFGDVNVIRIEGESRVVAGLREVYPRDGALAFADGRLTLVAEDGRPVAAEWVRFEIGQPLHSIHLSTDHGDLDVESIAIATELRLATGSGDVTVRGLDELTHMDLSSGLGDIRVRNCSADLLEANSGLGDIDLEGVLAAHAVLDSGLGDVDVDDSSIDLLSADTGLGDVEGDGNTIGRLEASTGLGEIDLNRK